MGALEAVLVVVFAVFAVADWRAAATGASRTLTKTAATVVLVVLAATAGEMVGDARAALIVAVVLCLIGDVALLDDRESRFLAGLGSFALGHVAYIVTALLVGVKGERVSIAIGFLVLLLIFQTVTKMLPGAARHGGRSILVAVTAYTAIIAAMVITATGTPSWAAMIGAKLFAVSDTMIGYNRFVRRFRHAEVPIMVTYHVGQLLLIAGLIAGG